MKKMVSLLIVYILIAGVVMSGCEKKSESEKAFEGLQKEANELGR